MIGTAQVTCYSFTEQRRRALHIPTLRNTVPCGGTEPRPPVEMTPPLLPQRRPLPARRDVHDTRVALKWSRSTQMLPNQPQYQSIAILTNRDQCGKYVRTHTKREQERNNTGKFDEEQY